MSVKCIQLYAFDTPLERCKYYGTMPPVACRKQAQNALRVVALDYAIP